MIKKDKYNVPIEGDDTFLKINSVASATECTGLMQTPPDSENEAESYTSIYEVPKPQENKFKSTQTRSSKNH